jgi:hypothetical protein
LIRVMVLGVTYPVTLEINATFGCISRCASAKMARPESTVDRLNPGGADVEWPTCRAPPIVIEENSMSEIPTARDITERSKTAAAFFSALFNPGVSPALNVQADLLEGA